MNTWNKLSNGFYADIGPFRCYVHPAISGTGATYSVSRDAGKSWPIKTGHCIDIEWAKQVSSNFAQSLLDIGAHP